MEKRAIQMDPHDNVATVLFDVQIGDMVWVYDQNQVLVERVVAQSPILSGNKLALSDHARKEHHDQVRRERRCSHQTHR